MKLEVIVHKRVIKFMKKHPELIIFYENLLNLLEEDNWEELDIKKLLGAENDYRVRNGKYRFFFRKEKEVLVIFMFDAGKRGDLY